VQTFYIQHDHEKQNSLMPSANTRRQLKQNNTKQK